MSIPWTPERKAKFQKTMARKAREKAAVNEKIVGQPKARAKNNATEEQEFEQQIAYAFGHVESWLHIFAGIAGYPQQLVTKRVGELLRGSSNRKMVRIED